MAARKLNRQNQIAPGLVLAQGPVPMSCLGGEVPDEAMLLDGYDAHLRLLENRPKTTAGTYRSHVKGFLRYLAINYPSVTLSEVSKLQVRGVVPSQGQPGDSSSHPVDQTVCCPQLLQVLDRRGPERGEPRLLGDPRESGPVADRVLQRPRGRRHHRVGLYTRRSPLAGGPGAPPHVAIHRLAHEGTGEPAHRAGRPCCSADLARRQGPQASRRPHSPPAGGRAPRVPRRAAGESPQVRVLVRQPQGQSEPPRSLRASGAAQSGGGGRDFGGRGRSALCSPLASQLRHEPHPPGR